MADANPNPYSDNLCYSREIAYEQRRVNVIEAKLRYRRAAGFPRHQYVFPVPSTDDYATYARHIGVHADEDGNLYGATGTWNSSHTTFTPRDLRSYKPDRSLRWVKPVSRYIRMDLSSNGKLWALSFSNGSPNDIKLESFSTAEGSQLSSTHLYTGYGFNWYNWAVFAKAGYVWVYDHSTASASTGYKGRVSRYTESGALDQIWEVPFVSTGFPIFDPRGAYYIFQMAVSDEGDVYLYNNHTLRRYDTDMNLQVEAELPAVFTDFSLRETPRFTCCMGRDYCHAQNHYVPGGSTAIHRFRWSDGKYLGIVVKYHTDDENQTAVESGAFSVDTLGNIYTPYVEKFEPYQFPFDTSVAPDGGVNVPDLEWLAARKAPVVATYIQQLRASINRLVDSRAFSHELGRWWDMNAGSPYNVYRHACGTRAQWGATGGPQDTWTIPYTERQEKPYDIEIGEVNAVLNTLTTDMG
jgi:hypothetical protein